MGIKYEFGKLEGNLRTIWGRTKAMMNSANLRGRMRGKLWVEGLRTATTIN